MDIKKYKHEWYLKHRDKIISSVKSRYIRKTEHKCKICGILLDKGFNWHYRYCDDCVNDKSKVSRQARWYRKNHKKIVKEK